jgi:hypothetical protein
VQNCWMTVHIEEKLDVISRLQKGECFFYIWHNIRFAHSSVCTRHENADRFTESAQSGPKLFMLQVCHSIIRMNCTINYECESLYNFIALQINKHIV